MNAGRPVLTPLAAQVASLRADNGLPPLPTDASADPTRGPQEVSPMLAVLAHESCPVNGEIISAGGGRAARVYLAETGGLVAPGLEPARFAAGLAAAGWSIAAGDGADSPFAAQAGPARL